MKLKEKVAIITGGGRGIGKAIATTFAAEGARVVIASRTISRLKEVADEINSRGGSARAIQTDISDEQQIQNMVTQTLEEYGQIDILVNNSANAAVIRNKVVDMSLSDWNKELAVTLTGVMLCSREVLKYMIPRKIGNIINLGSIAGTYGHPGRSAYCVSKWGIIGLTMTLAIEVGMDNIRVNCISPAATSTERFDDIQKSKAATQGMSYATLMANEILPHYSLNRIGSPEEVAGVAAFLASDESSAITGQNLIVNCGFHPMFP
ncbi:MAG: 3-oxoacyl-ACP reductase FabG [Dehalococcoidales bacterium]|nr:3-oxoacyl-ACP reductase FabG [Dehalococcoidales bacterium]